MGQHEGFYFVTVAEKDEDFPSAIETTFGGDLYFVADGSIYTIDVPARHLPWRLLWQEITLNRLFRT